MQLSKARQVARVVASGLLLAAIAACITGMLLLGVGVGNAGQTGTFNLFDRSFHLNKSDDMAPDLRKNDLVVVEHLSFAELKVDDFAAFYMEAEGEEHLLIRRITKVNGMTYTVADSAGEEFEISADSCRILGKATLKSEGLGQAVIFLQTADGRMIFIGWTAGIAVFLVGLTILLHVLWKLIFQKREGDGPVDELTGVPLSFDDPISLAASRRKQDD